MQVEYLQYKRSRFSTRLPGERLYTPSHCWLKEQADNVWHVGFTKFATRILGEPVEIDFEVELQAPIHAGMVVGWIEGFKAVTDLFCPLAGNFAGGNPGLDDNLESVQRDPYGEGWLYAVEGTPPDDCVDVEGYVAVLDGTIDKMLGKSA